MCAFCGLPSCVHLSALFFARLHENAVAKKPHQLTGHGGQLHERPVPEPRDASLPVYSCHTALETIVLASLQAHLHRHEGIGQHPHAGVQRARHDEPRHEVILWLGSEEEEEPGGEPVPRYLDQQRGAIGNDASVQVGKKAKHVL